MRGGKGERRLRVPWYGNGDRAAWPLLGSVRVGIDNVAERRVYLILNRETQANLPACHYLGGFYQTGGEMASDPLAKEGIWYLDFQSITITAKAEMDFLAEPEAKSKLAKPFRHCRPKC